MYIGDTHVTIYFCVHFVIYAYILEVHMIIDFNVSSHFLDRKLTRSWIKKILQRHYLKGIFWSIRITWKSRNYCPPLPHPFGWYLRHNHVNFSIELPKKFIFLFGSSFSVISFPSGYPHGKKIHFRWGLCKIFLVPILAFKGSVQCIQKRASYIGNTS